jgi:D-threo-aldose 1-dehydrogenase
MTLSLSDRRQVGTTTLSVPPFGFGAAHLGGMFGRVPGEIAYETLAAAWDGGVRFFDTAPYYGRGLSEHRVGNFLIDKPRDEFILTTKVGRYFRRPGNPRSFERAPWGGGLNMEIVWDYSYDGIMRAYEQSLLRLGLDTIDALLIHDPEASLGEGGPNIDDLARTGIKALEELKRSGHIKAIGMGLNATESIERYAKRVPLDFLIVAMPYTLLDQSALASGLKYCTDNAMSVVIGAPYASGILVTGPGPNARYRYQPAPADIQEKAGRIQAVCQRHGASLAAAALQFPLAHPAVVAVIPGGAKPEEVTSNLGYFGEAVPPQVWADLKAEGLIDPDAPTPA